MGVPHIGASQLEYNEYYDETGRTEAASKSKKQERRAKPR